MNILFRGNQLGNARGLEEAAPARRDGGTGAAPRPWSVPKAENARAEDERISAVIVNFNTRELTLQSLGALCATAPPGTDVWVVDNGSTDGSLEAVERFALSAPLPVRIVRAGTNLGFGAACNLGIEGCAGRFVVLVNSDAFVQAGALQKLRAYLLKHPEVGVVGPLLLNPDGSVQESRFPFPSPVRALGENLGLVHLARWWRGGLSPDYSLTHHWLSGACLMFPREVWVRSGGFDESFFLYAEETDWQRRLCDASWGIRFEPEACVVHLGGASGLSSKMSVREHFFTGADRYQLKHHGRGGALLFRAATALGAALRALLFACSDARRMRDQLWILHRQLLRPLPSLASALARPTPLVAQGQPPMS